MRILMLAHKLPYPPRTGDKVRAYHVARHLARDHQLTLACLVDEPDADGSLTALRQQIPDVEHATITRRRKRLQALLCLARGGSATMAYFDSPALRLRVDARLHEDRFDLIYASSSSMAQYVTRPRRIPFLMDFLDVDSDKWLQYGARRAFPGSWIYRLEGQRLHQHELAIARQADRCIVTTRQEEALLHSFAPWAPTSVVPNGVDLDYFRPAAAPTTAPRIVFTGAMDYFPNVDAVVSFSRHILPRIREEVPDAQFSIVGKTPASAVRRLAATPGVRVSGTVPDVRPFLQQAAVAVAPLRIARGVQNKVLEAMAMGLPVVGTRKSHEGIEARPGRDLLVEDDPGKFADLVVHLLRDAGLRAAVGRAARQFVEAHHSWTASMARLDRLLAEVIRPDSNGHHHVSADGLRGEVRGRRGQPLHIAGDAS
jgi:sugar transferase (PEP-CTERM/EpsH1 system associated)